MTQEEKKLLQDTAENLQRLVDNVNTLNNTLSSFLTIYYQTNFPSRMIVTKDFEVTGSFKINGKLIADITLDEGVDIVTGTTTGTKFGTATTQKIGFFGATPVGQQSAISAPAGGATVDAEARTAINSLRALVQTLGFTA